MLTCRNDVVYNTVKSKTMGCNMEFKEGFPLTHIVHNETFDETFTAYRKQNGVSWIGWIPELPEVKCEGDTVEIVQKELHDTLHQTLVAIEETWDEQFEADVKAGRLEPLIEKVNEVVLKKM